MTRYSDVAPFPLFTRWPIWRGSTAYRGTILTVIQIYAPINVKLLGGGGGGGRPGIGRAFELS